MSFCKIERDFLVLLEVFLSLSLLPTCKRTSSSLMSTKNFSEDLSPDEKSAKVPKGAFNLTLFEIWRG